MKKCLEDYTLSQGYPQEITDCVKVHRADPLFSRWDNSVVSFMLQNFPWGQAEARLQLSLHLHFASSSPPSCFSHSQFSPESSLSVNRLHGNSHSRLSLQGTQPTTWPQLGFVQGSRANKSAKEYGICYRDLTLMQFGGLVKQSTEGCGLCLWC